MQKKIIILSIVFAFSFQIAKGTTWFPSEEKCPICGKTNTYQAVGSYGSYIYSWSSKFQYIYWPLTDDNSIYCCVDCSYSTLMWDFDAVPEDKIEEIKLLLKTEEFEGRYKNYLQIPTTKRLEIAEKVYQIWGKDDSFWCQFYRVCGYHQFNNISEENSPENNSIEDFAFSYRKKALNIAFKMLNDSINSGKEKENLFIIAAMYNFTGMKDSALLYLEKAQTYTFFDETVEEENLQSFNTYLNELINEYIEAILNKEED